MSDREEYCMSCKASFKGNRIPQSLRIAYGDEEYFSLKIGIYSLYTDRITHWECPKCGYRWEASYGEKQ